MASKHAALLSIIMRKAVHTSASLPSQAKVDRDRVVVLTKESRSQWQKWETACDATIKVHEQAPQALANETWELKT